MVLTAMDAYRIPLLNDVHTKVGTIWFSLWLSAIFAGLTTAQSLSSASQQESNFNSPNPKLLDFFNVSTSGPSKDPCNLPGNLCFYGICRVNSTDETHTYCECPPGRTGKLCENTIGQRQCLHNTCFNGGTCYVEPTPKIFSCFCPPGYNGVLCEHRPSCDPACPDDSVCLRNSNGTYTCQCRSGYIGVPGNCTADNFVCRNVRCPPGTTCVSVASIYTCKPSEFFLESGHVTIVLPTLIPPDIATPPPFHPSESQFAGVLRKPPVFCSAQSCFNGGNCTADSTKTIGIRCECPAEWTGARCEVDTDECQLIQPCHNNGTCRNRPGTYECFCRSGFTGKLCETNIDDCVGIACRNGGRCVDEINGYRCQCSDRFMGRLCEKPFNPCSPGACMHGGVCRVSLQKNFTCVCQVGYTGARCETDIDDCVNVTCPNGQTCIDGLNSHVCTCPPGKGGANCDHPAKYCSFGLSANGSSSLCLNNGTCAERPNSQLGYSCSCPDHYAGHRCELYVGSFCETIRPCKFGTCANNHHSYECTCLPGYSGVNCTDNIDDCVSEPCKHDGVCIDDVNGHKCLCVSPFSGVNCETTLGGCDSNPCQNNGNCSEENGVVRCICPSGVTGSNCELVVGHQHITESLPNICDLPATKCYHNATCVTDNSSAGFKCICGKEYTGDHCESFVFNDSGSPDCPANFCKNGGLCTYDNFNSLSCNCTTGFSGPFCQFQEFQATPRYSPSRGFQSVCQPSPCGKGGRCVERGNGSFVCICGDGFTGEKCDQDINECSSGTNVCGNRTCVNTFGSYECECGSAYGGPNCSIHLTGCSNIVCPANAFCKPLWNETTKQQSHDCLCNYGYQGNKCDLETTASYTGQSLLAYISPTQGIGYHLSMRFRTTLPQAYMVTGDDILSTNVFRLELTDQQIRLSWGLSNPEPKIMTLGQNLSDGSWHGLDMTYSMRKLSLKLFDAYGHSVALSEVTVDIESLPVFSTKFGGIGGGRRQLSSEDLSNFVGCLQDIRVNDQWVIPSRLSQSSINVLPGCNRTAQCGNDTCRTNGKCLDLWVTHKCICERPFLPPNCDYSLKEATFGHEMDRNYAKIDMSDREKQSIEMSLQISLLLRTTASEGQLLYIGSAASSNSDLETFISAEIIDGRFRCNVKLGQKVQLFTGGPTLNDGNAQLLSIVRNENRFKVYLNKSLVIDDVIIHPFPHPLLAEYFYVGGIPNLPLPETFQPQARLVRQLKGEETVAISPAAFSSTRSFKGVIQDVRLREELIPLFPIPEAVRSVVTPLTTFGRTSLSGAVLQGTVSDNTCLSSPCANDGICSVTFNDFRCTCRTRWRGKTCSEADFCFIHGCPDNITCRNTDTNYQCLSPATFEKGVSSAVFDATIPDSKKQKMTTIRFKLRTRDEEGMVFYMGSSRAFISLGVQNGGLSMRYQLGSDSVSQAAANSHRIANAEWHQVSVDILAGKSTVTVDGTVVPGMFPVEAATTIGDLLMDGGRIVVGSIPPEIHTSFPQRFWTEKSFKGCVNDMQLLELSDSSNGYPLQLLDPQQLKAQKTLNSATFIPSSFSKIQTGCHSDPYCLADNNFKSVSSAVANNLTCYNNASCKDLWNAFHCDCFRGFNGERCETNIDDCKGHSCATGSTCVDGIATYTCACPPGFTGSRCEIDINDCESSPCKNGATCHDMIAEAQCTCSANYTGRFCELLITVDCASSPCMHGSTCRDVYRGALKTFECVCDAGYTGKQCETEIDYCASHPCQLPAKCLNQPRQQQYICQCDPGFTGKNCEVNIDECVSHQCQHGRCIDGIANYTCNCDRGWEGRYCEKDIDECLTGPCMSHSVCQNSPGNYSCQCRQFYLGVHCEFEGACLKSPCVRGECLQNVTSPAAFSCKCPLGYTGLNCSVEIDYCQPSPCANEAVCQRSIGAFQCVCKPGYTGTKCETNIDDCQPNPCKNGRCNDLVNAYQCDCRGTGYRGSECAEDIDECAENKSVCLHGICLNLRGSFNCSCGEEWVGRTCETRNPCLSNATNKCLNNGRCHSGRMSDSGEIEHDCTCQTPYEGPWCEHKKESLLSGTPIAYIIGPIIGALCLIVILAIIIFLMVARQKRATRGTYSPSRQEINGARLQLGPMMKPPPEERLI